MSQKTLLLENVSFHVAAALREDLDPFTPALLSILCTFIVLFTRALPMLGHIRGSRAALGGFG